MAGQTIGKLPEFTSDETQSEEKGKEEGGVSPPKATPEKEVENEKETHVEPPAIEKSAEEEETSEGDGVEDLERVNEQLKKERERLMVEIRELRGERREVKQQQIDKIETAIDELKDVHPDDVKIVEKVLHSKGYMTKDEVSKQFYKGVKDAELEKFLNQHPEYKPENDPNDLNWSILQRELQFYRLPENPNKIGEMLEKAHRAIERSVFNERSVDAKRHLANVAGMGQGGQQRSSSTKSLTARDKAIYESGGWSEEEIRKIEQRLPD